MDLFSNELLDLSVNASPKNVDIDQLSKKIADSILQVLSQKFTHKDKKKVININGRINFACPFCGDSIRNPHKKRGNLYLKNLHYKCYNTGCENSSMSFSRFLIECGMEEGYTASELMYIRSVKSNDLSLGFTQISRFTSSLKELDKYAVDRKFLMELLMIKEVHNTKVGLDYIRKRKQLHVDNRLFAFDDRNNDLYMLNLNSDKTKVISLQIRHLYPKMGQRFTTYNYSKIITDFVKIDDPDPDIMELMDRYGLIYNICLVDMNKQFDVLEGPIDANHITNSVATMSASTKVYSDNARYIYDNATIDAAGAYAAAQSLDAGLPTFAWKKFITDYSHLSNCKDINDIMKLDDTFPINDVKNDYFVNDKLDLIYV